MDKEFNGRLMQDMVDEAIQDLQLRVDKLKDLRQMIDPYTFYQCKEHGAYGIRTGDEIRCKMCKRMAGDVE